MHQPTHPQTNRQTGPITIHCVAASVRVFKYLADKWALTVPGTSLKWTAQCHYQYTPVYTYLPTPIAAVYYLSLTITLSGPHLHNDWLPVLKQKQLSHIVHSSGCKRDRKAPPGNLQIFLAEYPRYMALSSECDKVTTFMWLPKWGWESLQGPQYPKLLATLADR